MAKKNTQIVKQAPAQMARPLEDWEQAMLEQAKQEVATETAGMPRITHKSGVLKIDEKPVSGNKLACAVVDFVFSKAYYEGEYDPSTPQTPVCYAFGVNGEDGMAPHPNAPKPQHEACAGCPHNAFGTAERGRGKRCKDERRLGVVIETQGKAIQKAEVRMLSVPPGSLKNWAMYLRNAVPEVTQTGNVRAVITEVSTEPSGGAYALTFRPVDRPDKEAAQAIMLRKDQIRTMLVQPYPTIEAEEKPQPKKKLKGQ